MTRNQKLLRERNSIYATVDDWITKLERLFPASLKVRRMKTRNGFTIRMKTRAEWEIKKPEESK